MRPTNCRGDDDNNIENNSERMAPVQGDICVGSNNEPFSSTNNLL